MVPGGEYMLTLKARGVLVDGSINGLREELYLARRATQYIIDCLWELDKLPTLNQAHQMFYRVLRGQGFRAHQCKQIYEYALGIVKSAKRNGGRKPVLRKLSTRLDKYDAKVDLENQLVVVKLRNRVFKIKLLHRRDYVGKFLGRKWYEVTISIDKQSRIWICIPFRWEYNPYNPRRLIAHDTNLRHLVFFDGKRFRRVKTRFIKALSLKAHAENLQKKYPKMWRYSKRILCRIRSLHRCSRNIVVDWSRKYAKYLVLKARRMRAGIVLEDLEKLWNSISKRNSTLTWRLSRFAYRKLLHAIIIKCIEYNVPLILINPRNTSTMCSKCGAKLDYNHRLAICPNCKITTDRDKVGALNIYLRALKGMWGSHGSPLN
ncbi:MAG: transposase, partial [Thermoprotei archaeon]